jgi:Flp pilus assembly protein TadG
MRKIGKKSERGNAALEFALGWSVLWMIFSGVYQFGYSFYVYNVLMTSVTNAAQLGSKMNYDTEDTAAYTTALQNMVLYGDTTAGTTTLVPRLLRSNVSVSVTAVSGIPRDVTISITGYSIDGLFKSFLMNGKPRVTTMYYGRVTCASC